MVFLPYISKYSNIMKKVENLLELRELFKLVNNEDRIRVANLLLMVDEITVGDISECLSIGQSMTSRFLSDLKVRGCAISRRDAQSNYYKLTDFGKFVFRACLSHFQDLPELKEDIANLRTLGY